MKYFIAILIFVSSLAQANAACTAPCTKAQILNDINALWPNNTTNIISPAKLRTPVISIINSYLDLAGAASFTCPSGQFINAIPSLSIYSCAVPAGGGSTGANPTATAGPIAVNGVATTFMRSDGAPAIQLGTNAVKGLISGDGATINCVAGVCTATTGGGGSVTTVSVVTANGISGSVANATSTPAITLTLGAITPTTVNGNTVPTAADTIALLSAIQTMSNKTFVAPALGTPASGNLANTTGYSVANLNGAGTGILTALGINIGSAGAPVLFNGAGGTPSSLTGTNISGTATALNIGGNSATATTATTASAVAVGGITGAGAGCITWLTTPTSANLRSCLTDEVGTGAAYFIGGALGTPASVTLTNGTGLVASTGTTATGTPSSTTFLRGDNSWATPSGSGTPGGSTTQVQYNNAGAFGGITGATTNGTALTLAAPILGTPASATLTNATGLPISTGVSGLGSNVATFLATPSSVNLAAALTDETGTGSVVFNTQPVFGTCSSSKTAPSSTNMNFYLYNATSTNFQGVGCDNATGDMFFATGTSGPTNSLSIAASGLVSVPRAITGTNTYFACLDSNNGILRQASACTISSIRFKDLGPMVASAEALDKIISLQPISFKMKKYLQTSDVNTQQTQLGLTAENVAAIDVRASVWEDDGVTPKSYRPESIIALLVGAVHQLKADNDNLKKQLAKIKKKLL